MSPRICWNCQKPATDEHFCAWCGKILPHRQGLDYFSFLDLPRKLSIDLADLEKRFHALSRRLHPDNFSRATEKEKQMSLDKSAVLNDAHRTLKDPVARAEYLLTLEGQQSAANSRQAPPELLEEIFELNEWLAELKASPRSEKVEHRLTEMRRRLEKAKADLVRRVGAFGDELRTSFERWDTAVDMKCPDGERQALLSELGKTLARRNYLRNLVREVSAALEEQTPASKSE